MFRRGLNGAPIFTKSAALRDELSMEVVTLFRGFCLRKPWTKCDSRSFDDKMDNLLSVMMRLNSGQVTPKAVSQRLNSSSFLKRNLSIGMKCWEVNERRFHHLLYCKAKTVQLREQAEADELNDSLELYGSVYIDDPVRAYYTLWHFDSHTRGLVLDSQEKVRKAFERTSQSKRVEECIAHPPSGGVQGLKAMKMGDLSNRGQITLLRWARLTSDRETGYESGADEKPMDLWNAAIKRIKRRQQLSIAVATNHLMRVPVAHSFSSTPSDTTSTTSPSTSLDLSSPSPSTPTTSLRGKSVSKSSQQVVPATARKRKSSIADYFGKSGNSDDRGTNWKRKNSRPS